MSNARQQCAKSRLKDYMMTKQHMLLTYVFWEESDWLERLVSEMTYNVLMGTLNPTHSFTHSLTHSSRRIAVERQSNRSRDVAVTTALVSSHLDAGVCVLSASDTPRRQVIKPATRLRTTAASVPGATSRVINSGADLTRPGVWLQRVTARWSVIPPAGRPVFHEGGIHFSFHRWTSFQRHRVYAWDVRGARVLTISGAPKDEAAAFECQRL